MNMHEFSRTELLLGAEGLEKLKHASVMVFGVAASDPTALRRLREAGWENWS